MLTMDKHGVSKIDGTDVAQEPSSHTIRKERLSQKWTELRSSIYITMIRYKLFQMNQGVMYVEIQLL